MREKFYIKTTCQVTFENSFNIESDEEYLITWSFENS